jgi:UMF1 family MFS transporter
MPISSGVADYTGTKKRFMRLFSTLGAAACIGLYFFTATRLEYGILMFVLASVGYAGSLVFYNAFLPEIATPDRYDSVSARGFSLGYAGSVLLLIINIISIQKYDFFGFETVGDATRACFLTVGVWWILFSQITFHFLKDKPIKRKIGKQVLLNGFKELKKVFGRLSGQPNTRRYLFSFFFFSMGVQTVMYLAPLFGEHEIGVKPDELIVTVLLLQLLAIAGAYLFAALSEKKGNKFSMMLMLLIWIGICIGAYFTVTTFHFYILASCVGLVMGGVQSLARSTYSKLLPANVSDTASYFSFYDITEKLSIVIGTASYGIINQMTGNMRGSVVALGIYFTIGALLLNGVSVKIKTLA